MQRLLGAPREARAQPAGGGRRGRRLLRALRVAGVALGSVYLGAGAVLANEFTTPKRVFYPPASDLIGAPYQEVRFPARGDGVEIAGWYVPREGATRALIVAHGKDQNRSTEFFDIHPQGRLTEMAGKLAAAGYAVLMIDLRGHGRSGDARLSFGVKERRDVMGAADWLKAHGFQPGSIGAWGVSLGAASVVGATVEDTDIGALVIDSCFAEFCPALKELWSSLSGLPDLLRPPTLLMSRVLYGIDICAAKPVAEIGRIAPRPVLIIHTVNDEFLPISHAERNKAELPTAELWLATGKEHARNYNADPAEYVRRVTGFFGRTLPA